MAATQAARMLSLFEGNQRSSGRFDPKSGKMFTEYAALQEKDFEKHLNGAQGMGSVPIRDDDTCSWGAIDIDNHGQEDDIPIAPVDEKIILHRLPAIACRSKSGGVHIYTFFQKPRAASKVRAILARWATLLDFPKTEIFPKQARLIGEPGKKQLGNWINLPYLGGDASNRYAFNSSKKLSLEEFLDKAEALRISDSDLAATVLSLHPQAPPCVQRMMIEGVPQGKRNEALFNATIYFKRLDEAEYENYAASFNVEAFDKPLGRVEFTRTVTSASRPDYTYRCNEEPIRSFCNRTECLKRQFGITPTESTRVEEISGLPAFTDLIKYLTEPVRWSFQMDGVRVVNVPTDVLLDWSKVRTVIAEQLTRVVPLIKNTEWDRILQPLMAGARIETVPDEAGLQGLMRERLRDFAGKIKKANGHNDVGAILRGLPVVYEDYVCFRAQDFVNFLKRTRTEEIKGVGLWFALMPLGVEQRRVRVDSGTVVRVWGIPIDKLEGRPYQKAELPKPEL